MLKPKDFFSYLSGDVPEWLEDERITKANQALKSLENIPQHIRDARVDVFKKAFLEEIDLEKEKAEPDAYVIRRLSGFLDNLSKPIED